jgi:hypothetical protein
MLEAARRESTRDQLMVAIPEPSEAVLAVLHQQHPDGDPAQLARRWRWQQWCQQHGAARVASHFLARKAGLDQVSFWRLACSDGDLIGELYQQLREGESSFEQLAQQGGEAWQVSFSGPVALEQVPPDLAGLLRVSAVGELWAPRQLADGRWQLLRLELLQAAVLDDTLRARLVAELGEASLAQMLRQPNG